MPEEFNRESVIQAYLRHAALGPGDEEYFWGWEAVTDFVNSRSAAEACELVLELLDRASEAEVGSVIAGPLEDLVCRHGTSLIGDIERRAVTDDYFRWALGGIWLSKGELPDDVLGRIVRASGDAIKPTPPLEELD
ncbi:MAG: DUF6869 domain-containing protein [Gemmatimonadaceae bacterium]